jgi:hypothetical protein
MELEFYESVKSRVIILVKYLDQYLDKESIDYANYYISHDEIEIAFESLCLSFVDTGYDIEKFIYDELIDISVILKIDKEAVLNDNTWDYIQKIQIKN